MSDMLYRIDNELKEKLYKIATRRKLTYEQTRDIFIAELKKTIDENNIKNRTGYNVNYPDVISYVFVPVDMLFPINQSGDFDKWYDSFDLMLAYTPDQMKIGPGNPTYKQQLETSQRAYFEFFMQQFMEVTHDFLLTNFISTQPVMNAQLAFNFPIKDKAYTENITARYANELMLYGITLNSIDIDWMTENINVQLTLN